MAFIAQISQQTSPTQRALARRRGAPNFIRVFALLCFAAFNRPPFPPRSYRPARPLHATPTTNSKWVLRKRELDSARRSRLAIVIISLGCHLYFLPRRTRQRAEGFLNAFFLECCWSLDQGVDLSRSQIRVYSTLVSHSRHAMRKCCM